MPGIDSNKKQTDAVVKSAVKKDRVKQTLAVAGGFIAGSAGSVVALQNIESIAAIDLLHLFKDNTGNDLPKVEITDATLEVVVNTPVTESKIASTVSNSMNFSQAYEQARKEVGSGGVFAWHGQLFNTFSAAEWDSMSDVDKQNYLNDINTDAIDLSYDAPVYSATSQTHRTAKTETDDNSILESLQLQQNTSSQELNDAPIVTVVAEEQTVEPETFASAPDIVEIAALPDDPKAEVKNHASLVDTDGDNNADGIKIDFENNKLSDVILVDTDNNSKPEKIYYDTDQDAKPDMVIYDADEDGNIDGADPLGAAPKDDFDINNPDKNDFDNNADVDAWEAEK
ncbi:hypothetical protein [Ferruginibacter sp.]|nr:hypothetical protein [Ferruginibacter sp.]